MRRETLHWFENLSKALIWGAGFVILLSIIGALAIASSSSSLPVIGEIQRESRGIATIGALGAGFTAGGLLAGLGALLHLQVVDRLERLVPAARGGSRDSEIELSAESSGAGRNQGSAKNARVRKAPESKRRSSKRKRRAFVDAEADYPAEPEGEDSGEDPHPNR